MPSATLTNALAEAQALHAAAVDALVPLLVEVALAAIDEALPGTVALVTLGEMNEDWAFTLRIERVLDGAGGVLYDAASGSGDANIVEMIDEVDTEYLDLLLDLTGEDYWGRQVITAPSRSSS